MPQYFDIDDYIESKGKLLNLFSYKFEKLSYLQTPMFLNKFREIHLFLTVLIIFTIHEISIKRKKVEFALPKGFR